MKFDCHTHPHIRRHTSNAFCLLLTILTLQGLATLLYSYAINTTTTSANELASILFSHPYHISFWSISCSNGKFYFSEMTILGSLLIMHSFRHKKNGRKSHQAFECRWFSKRTKQTPNVAVCINMHTFYRLVKRFVCFEYISCKTFYIFVQPRLS